jgi:UV DNA damage repair endonuclease
MRWLREHKNEAEQRQWDIMNHNAAAALRMVERVGSLPEHKRMVRLGSEMLQGYTEPDWIEWWQQADVQRHLEQIFAPIGERARQLGVRLSFHPGQFCVLASVNENIVERSIEEFEYHADMARWMGYGKSFQDFKINVHISGRQGPEGIRKVLGRLSPEARNTITIENEENSWGLDDCLTLGDVVPIVLDIHHHWCREGEYLDPNSDRVKRVLDSWRGVRPAMHYSVSREDLLVGHDPDTLPNMTQLLAQGFKKQKLRAHSDFYWNRAVNAWAASFSPNFDIQCESKGKNLARDQFVLSQQLSM